jgi:cytochrome c oxidase assembly protein subunit 15
MAKHGQARQDVPLPVSGGLPGRRSFFSVARGRATLTSVETSLPRLRGLRLPAAAFRRIALGNVVMLFVIVTSGAFVRLTGSGLGCEHWPGCNAGTQIFPTTYHSYVEFSNRVISGVAVLATLATWLVAWLTPSLRSWVRWVAFGAFAGTLAEAPLGAITVKYHLNPWLVGTHFLLSLVVLALAVLAALEAWELRGDTVPPWVRRVGLVVAAAAAVLVVTGTFATAAGPHSGSVAVPRVWSFRPAVWLHVRATAVFGISFLLLTVWLALNRRRQLGAAFLVLGVLAVQMTVGEVQYRTKLPWWLVLTHVSLAAALWASVACFVALLWRPAASRMG